MRATELFIAAIQMSRKTPLTLPTMTFPSEQAASEFKKACAKIDAKANAVEKCVYQLKNGLWQTYIKRGGRVMRKYNLPSREAAVMAKRQFIYRYDMWSIGVGPNPFAKQPKG